MSQEALSLSGPSWEHVKRGDDEPVDSPVVSAREIRFCFRSPGVEEMLKSDLLPPWSSRDALCVAPLDPLTAVSSGCLLLVAWLLSRCPLLALQSLTGPGNCFIC